MDDFPLGFDHSSPPPLGSIAAIELPGSPEAYLEVDRSQPVLAATAMVGAEAIYMGYLGGESVAGEQTRRNRDDLAFLVREGVWGQAGALVGHVVLRLAKEKVQTQEGTSLLVTLGARAYHDVENKFMVRAVENLLAYGCKYWELPTLRYHDHATAGNETFREWFPTSSSKKLQLQTMRGIRHFYSSPLGMMTSTLYGLRVFPKLIKNDIDAAREHILLNASMLTGLGPDSFNPAVDRGVPIEVNLWDDTTISAADQENLTKRGITFYKRSTTSPAIAMFDRRTVWIPSADHGDPFLGSFQHYQRIEAERSIPMSIIQSRPLI